MTRIAAIFAALLLAAPAWAAESVPVPRQKPARQAVASDLPVPIPRAKPRRTDATLPMTPPEGDCLSRLAQMNAVVKPLPAISEGRCGSATPLQLSSVAGVALEPPAILTCEMAASMAAWIGEVVKPSARRRLKTDITSIRVAASYVCRLRNNQGSGKLSEHAMANALDMSGFGFAGTKDVTVGGGWGGLSRIFGLSGGASFLGEVRSGACQHFTTVLGPGSDPHHGDHFHVDAQQRRGGYRICQ